MKLLDLVFNSINLYLSTSHPITYSLCITQSLLERLKLLFLTDLGTVRRLGVEIPDLMGVEIPDFLGVIMPDFFGVQIPDFLGDLPKELCRDSVAK